ncbi:MAG: hypothetical protein LQ339_005869 [Xanthoria mediterranea]|nr:MAG: hypothetical protein LQ339_005869 [Xanthoria mediterranea]
MDLSQSLLSPQYDLCKADIPTPAKDLPLTPPSTGTSTPYQTSTHCPPRHSDLEYVTHRLWSGSQRHHARRFSCENPTCPHEERYWTEEPLRPYHTQDDDATIVNNSTPSRSRSSQTTLCGSVTPAEQPYSTVFSRLPQYSYDKALPPTPPTSRLDSPRSPTWCEGSPMRSRKRSLAGSSISSPFCTTRTSSLLRNSFFDPREAPKPPVVEEKSEEKSGWDSDSEDEDEDTIRKSKIVVSKAARQFQRRISNPLQALLCLEKGPRRRSA